VWLCAVGDLYDIFGCHRRNPFTHSAATATHQGRLHKAPNRIPSKNVRNSLIRFITSLSAGDYEHISDFASGRIGTIRAGNADIVRSQVGNVDVRLLTFARCQAGAGHQEENR
jgi:hypothetical protein